MSSANTPSKEQTPQWEILVQYILTYQHHCDKYLSPIADPKGKSVLIIGCGAGTEILWCIRNQAKSITAIDTRPHDPTVVEEAMKRISVKCRTSVDVHKMSLYEAYSLKGQYDLVLSNNVFEHLEDVNKAFSICRQLVLPGEGRIAIFTNPLYYSSMGAHLSGIEPWEHLWTSPEKSKERPKNGNIRIISSSTKCGSEILFKRSQTIRLLPFS